MRIFFSNAVRMFGSPRTYHAEVPFHFLSQDLREVWETGKVAGHPRNLSRSGNTSPIHKIAFIDAERRIYFTGYRYPLFMMAISRYDSVKY